MGLDTFATGLSREEKFSPVECRKIYNAIKDIQFHLDENSIYSQYMLEILSIFKKMFHHCARRRVNLYYR